MLSQGFRSFPLAAEALPSPPSPLPGQGSPCPDSIGVHLSGAFRAERMANPWKGWLLGMGRGRGRGLKNLGILSPEEPGVRACRAGGRALGAVVMG